jgi:hypothetical protein
MHTLELVSSRTAASAADPATPSVDLLVGAVRLPGGGSLSRRADLLAQCGGSDMSVSWNPYETFSHT